ncbi:MAG: helix-turn-helix transcriptional regulator [Methyloprofundus sp.]|nr:helix-turn-helix transcriptional regulator [Methyloprofundus sp.]
MGMVYLRIELKVSRIQNQLSQKQLAKLVGVSQQTIAKWELGVTTPSHFKHLRKLESVLEKPANHLFPDLFLEFDKVQ